ncbi:hypothetical protein [Flavobacterium sp.]|uniref:hypothetical protein n=1 Tax=Flavobacterium sp. TaxID=239 RepID=UPI0037506ADE
MKKILFVFLIAALTFFSGCSKDEEVAPINNESYEVTVTNSCVNGFPNSNSSCVPFKISKSVYDNLKTKSQCSIISFTDINNVYHDGFLCGIVQYGAVK